MTRSAFVFAAVLLSVLSLSAEAQDLPKWEPTKNDLATPPTETKLIVRPARQLTSNWIFVVDNSDSMRRNFGKARQGFHFLTQAGTDQWRFKVLVFSNTFKLKSEKWAPASPTAFDEAERWISHPDQKGISSFGAKALFAALGYQENNGKWVAEKTVANLTVVLISDGGFTSSSGNKGHAHLLQSVAEIQALRAKSGIGPAIITTVMIDNPHYNKLCCPNSGPWTRHYYDAPDTPEHNYGGKASNRDCMAFMRLLGKTYAGGMLLVKNKATAPKHRRLTPYDPKEEEENYHSGPWMPFRR